MFASWFFAISDIGRRHLTRWSSSQRPPGALAFGQISREYINAPGSACAVKRFISVIRKICAAPLDHSIDNGGSKRQLAATKISNSLKDKKCR